MHPYRSMLYMPGSNPRALDKARGLPADALILDLEDAVAPDAKAAARDLVCQAVAEGGYGARRLLIRINALDTPWGPEDLAAAVAARPHAILLPKVNGAADLAPLDAALGAAAPDHPTKLWAMMETPRGILNAAEIATAPRLEGMVMGTNDLLKDLGGRATPNRMATRASLGLCLLAARAAGLLALDGVYNAYKDFAGLEAEALQGRDMGFDGKTLIHPAQLEVANRIFAPTPAEIELAEAQVAAFEVAVARGEGVAVLDGSIVENLHVETARQTLAKAAAIAQLEG